MKKIFFSIVAIAALAACTKSEVAYEQPAEIGFKAVAGNMTKAAVDGTEYPTTLDMYVYAWTTDFTGAEANYINKGLFVCKNQTFEDYTDKDDATDVNPIVWGGKTPYYWPNTKELHFAGYSASGNVADLNPSYDCASGILSIEGYMPGSGTGKGANDLMFFPATDDSYGKDTDYVPVEMLHTCSWITFKVKGDGVTGGAESTYAVESLTVTGIYGTGNLTCTEENIDWNFDTYTANTTSTVLVANSALSIKNTSATSKVAETTENNTVLIPQLPGMLTLEYSYTSPAGVKITEIRSDLDLTLDGTATKTSEWLPGKHYIYTITIKANEILIAPTPVEWENGNNPDITVE